MWIALVGFLGWAAAILANAALAAIPAATLVPLPFLAVTFEIVFSLHTSVERIGGYVQVFFEDEATDEAWERRLAAFFGRGRTTSAAGDPLFADYFWIAAILNSAARDRPRAIPPAQEKRPQ